jgi:glycosyltransferase involved in cell wall biosynthesis
MLMLFPLLDECDVILANYYLTSYPIAFSSLFKRTRHNINLIQGYEPIISGETESTYPGLKKWLAETSYRFPMEQIAISNWIAKRVSQISKRNVHIIHPNIDLSVFKPSDGSTIRNKKSILAFPSGDIYKGWEDIIQAFDRLKNVDTGIKVIASSRFPFPLPPGPYFGMQPKNDQELVSIYQSATVYVHPCWYEGFGLAPLEAMACGTPVVAAASEGILEYVVDGENCLLVPPKSPPALAEAIQRMIHDEPLQARLIAGGYETVKRFAWPKMADQFEELLISICNNGSILK